MSGVDLGLLALRLGVGGALVAHGTQKLFGWFGGQGPVGTGEMLESMGFAPGRRSAVLAGLGQAGGGALLAVGLGTAPAAAAATGTMAVASATTAENGFFNLKGGFELSALYGLAATSLALTGPGRYSVDAATRGALNRPWLGLAAYALSLGSAAYLVWDAKRATGKRTAVSS